MNSLRARIALNCALLLIGAIAILSLFYTIASRTILYDQTKLRLNGICEQIIQFAERTDSSLFVGGGESPEVAVTDTRNLDNWQSTTTYVQVDTVQDEGGRQRSIPIGKSSNLASITINPNPLPASPGHILYREARTPVGHLLVADEMIMLPTGMIVLHVAENLDLIDNTLGHMQIVSIVLLLIAIPAVAFSSLLISANAMKPIHNLIATMREIGSDRLDRRVDIAQRTDELGELARTFDAMLARLEESFARERRFIADASHELRTPLTVINANAHMLQRWAQSNEQVRRDSIEAIAAESSGLGRLLEELLLLARADSGDSVLREPVDLATIAEELVISTKTRALEKGLELDLQIIGDRHRMLILGNRVLLRRVLANVIDNALKYTQRGGIYVELTLPETSQTLVCAVHDTGIGIPLDARERIFERLYRIDESRSRQTEGFGLGLSIARAFVKIHNGSIYAESGKHGGATISMSFPITTVHAA